ncbi:uncharacterized protein LOC113206864 [Frankliniella occidentalis]|uniref:Uncharacterized protein LOC113206864 n=1 Tax=Frankliniella occidentalis TaxID=133901 RepID=A0A6J1SCK7_FRAOC|nr:uncharacterized protein LOC113206864 [Frankliniella occidentalis]XP_052121407.1 uncharacterized protein LOC113206864 [Frankliniella occidentalis]
MRDRWRAKQDGTGKKTPVDALLDQLQSLKDDDPASIVVLSHDPQLYMIQNVFFQTLDMRMSLEKFPEVLVMDTTYKLCDNEMPLVFSVVDSFGVGRIAGYCLIISKKKEVVTASLEALTKGFPNLAVTNPLC